MTIHTVAVLVASLAAALYKVAALEGDRTLRHRLGLLERVRGRVDGLTSTAVQVQLGKDHEAALELGKRRLYHELAVVDPLLRSTELMTRAQLDAQSVINQSESATVELNEAERALAPYSMPHSLGVGSVVTPCCGCSHESIPSAS